MTNGLGKSDSPVVPAKSPNKAGQPVAEGMEGRGLAKGNLRQQNASRTLEPERRAECAGAGTTSSKKGQEVAVHGAPSPRVRRPTSARGVSQP